MVQCVAVCVRDERDFASAATSLGAISRVAVCCSVVQCVAGCCSVLPSPSETLLLPQPCGGGQLTIDTHLEQETMDTHLEQENGKYSETERKL